MSAGYHALPIYLAFIIIILYRNSFHWTRLWTNFGSANYLPNFTSSHNFDLDTTHEPPQMAMLQDMSLNCLVYLSSTDDKGGGDTSSGESKPSEAPSAIEESPPAEEPPPPEPPESRIPTYDEYERFKHSARPPDSHYESGPLRRRSSCEISKLSCVVMVWSLVLKIVT